MNVSSNKINETDSPKTPGGISKSLLTPCRRVGLSRKWKQNGLSPFISPLGNTNSTKELKQDRKIRKRKICQEEVEEQDTGEDRQSVKLSPETHSSPKTEIDLTPTRNLLPRKKSKTLITTQKCIENLTTTQNVSETRSESLGIDEKKLHLDCNVQEQRSPNVCKNDTNIQLSKINSKSNNNMKNLESSTKTSNKSSSNKALTNCSYNKNVESENNDKIKNNDDNTHSIREKSPNNLTKECMVVIQKKIFKSIKTPESNIKKQQENKSASQSLFDSDSDDVPLSHLNKQDTKANHQILKQTNSQPIIAEAKKGTENNLEKKINTKKELPEQDLEDNDFVEMKKVNIKKVERTTSTTGLKIRTNAKPKQANQTKKNTKPSLQNLCEEDDDFDYSKSKTIQIKKTYDKVTKPSKAKSTGSITQKDIDDITARIESKKNLLLAKAMTEETKELRELIKKWQVGCQTALMELLDLMRKKLPEQNMEHSELLKMLKIPPELVGYDSDCDSFNTPDDTAIVLSALKIN